MQETSRTTRRLRRRSNVNHDETSCCYDDNVCKIQNTSSSSISLSRLTLSTVETNDDDEFSQISLSEDIPLEVVIINDDHEGPVNAGNNEHKIPSSIRGHNSTDIEIVAGQEEIYDRLKMYENVIISYKQKLKSSESLNNSLHKYLRQTQEYAENLTSERRELITTVEDIENEDNKRVDQELLMKFILCSCLFFYFLGGSHNFLVGAAVLQLIVTVVSITI
mmetsp:Transcript_61142/g.68467  ORF Transcript_61142/g.68467 Transcript_61142/m.68467 type:complete len:221 (+) Transcript_61142:97-759(+)